MAYAPKFEWYYENSVTLDSLRINLSKLVYLFFQIYENIPIGAILLYSKNLKNTQLLYKQVLKVVRSLDLCIICNVSDVNINYML